MAHTIHSPRNGDIRPVIEQIKPEINAGRYPIKRCQGDILTVDATVIVDGHDLLSCELLYRHEKDKAWSVIPMRLIVPGRDLWSASFRTSALGEYLYTVRAWVDHFQTWKHQLEKRQEAKQDLSVYLEVGYQLVQTSFRLWNKRMPVSDKRLFHKALRNLAIMDATYALGEELSSLMARYPDRRLATHYARVNRVVVDRQSGRFSAWYEFFPRSFGGFKKSEKMIPYVRSMGFDTIYLPPIHPIGAAFRKGKNNSLTAGPTDPGSPWGIGSASGGHTAIHPELGSFADFKHFLRKARNAGLDVAIDIAYQCSPDHPIVKRHPEWFKSLPDGSIQYAENPPKKYQDIYPFYFESKHWEALWRELRNVVLFWCKQGIRTFRVDNPHTKPFGFWEWLIREIKKEYPDALFLAEAFTRPSVMYNLAKLGFSQSYTYFTWRNTPAEFKKYLEELTQTEVAEFYRPHFWPNTPDILPIHLQKGGRPSFLTRVALAATLSSTYGIYGPAYELGDNTALKEGGEEYLNSEKYEIKNWDLLSRSSIRPWIAKINAIRRSNPALHDNRNLTFHDTGNDQVVCFSKHTPDRTNIVLIVANLDFKKTRKTKITLKIDSLGLPARISAFDLVKKTVHPWKANAIRLTLRPQSEPVMIFRLKAAKSK